MEQPRVRDLMLSLGDYATIHGEKTIKDALLALKEAQRVLSPARHFHRALLVLDDVGRVVGKLSQWAILRSLEPKLIKHEDEASLARAGLTEDFIVSLKETYSLAGGLDLMCRTAGRIKAKDAMTPLGESIDEKAPLTEAIHQMVLRHAQSILVTRDDQIIGILRQSDVFEEISEIIRSTSE